MKTVVTAATAQHNISADLFKELVLQGKSIFTVVSNNTQTRFTFKVKASHHRQGWWVYVLNGSDNMNSYSYIGFINGVTKQFRPSSQYIHNNGVISVKFLPKSILAFNWLWSNVHTVVGLDRINNKLTLFHEGRCARCGHVLTDPLSIERGMGKDCYELTH